MTWDYFVSHASEDKELVARPLAHVLAASKFRVWYDEFELRVGESLFQSISRGLAASSFGIVVLSPAFMQKSWTQNELGGIWARETADRKLVLPVWHRVGAREVAERMPMLADRVAVSTAKGLQHVAEEIVRASFPDRLAHLPMSLQRADNAEHARNVLRTLLDSGTTVGDLRLFLSAHQELLPRRGILIPAFKVGAETFADFVIVAQDGITGPIQMDVVVLGPCDLDGLEVGDAVTSLTTSILTQLGEKKAQAERGYNSYLGAPYVGEYPGLQEVGKNVVRMLVGEQPLQSKSPSNDHRNEVHRGWNIHMRSPDAWSVRLLLLVGRRAPSIQADKPKIASDLAHFVEVASYDRLLDSPREF